MLDIKVLSVVALTEKQRKKGERQFQGRVHSERHLLPIAGGRITCQLANHIPRRSLHGKNVTPPTFSFDSTYEFFLYFWQRTDGPVCADRFASIQTKPHEYLSGIPVRFGITATLQTIHSETLYPAQIIGLLVLSRTTQSEQSNGVLKTLNILSTTSFCIKS